VAKYNPFNPNSVVAPNLFAGRTKQVFKLLEKLEHVKRGMSSSFVLHGDRGIGKTALAKLIKHAASAKDQKLHNLSFITSYYSVEKGQDLQSVLQASLNSLTDQLEKSVIDRLSERVGSIFKGGKFAFGAFSVELDSADAKAKLLQHQQILKDQIVSALTNIIKGSDDLVAEGGGGKGTDGTLIIIDEVHNLSDLRGAAQVLRSIATTLDVNGFGKISFLVIGYSESIQDFFEGDPSAKRHFDQIQLTIMPIDEAALILTKGFDEAEVTYDAKEVTKYVAQTGGYPHLIQLLGHNVLSLNPESTNITTSKWDTAILKTAVDLQQKDFSSLYDFTGKQTLRENLMDVMAIANRPLTKQEAKDLCSGRNIYQATVLGALKKIGAVKENKDTGELTLQSLLFRSAIIMKIFSQKNKDEHVKKTIEFNERMEAIEAKNTLLLSD
jgi:hypothetical protein